MNFVKMFVLCLLVCSFGFSAFADHITNKWKVRENLQKDGWKVFYLKEFDHEEYLKLSTALALDTSGGSGVFTNAYLTNFLTEVVSDFKNQSPSVQDAIRTYVIDNLSLVIRGKSFNSIISGVQIDAGRATYNRSECTRIKECLIPNIFRGGCEKWVDSGKRCIDTPNTYQLYVRLKTSPSVQTTVKPNQENNTPSIQSIYRDILERQPDPEGLQTWTNALNSGTSLNSVRRMIAESPEAQSKLNALYEELLCRKIDAQGQSTWTNNLANGWTLRRVSLEGIKGSVEYKNRNGLPCN
jgi:hypothetical protein